MINFYIFELSKTFASYWYKFQCQNSMWHLTFTVFSLFVKFRYSLRSATGHSQLIWLSGPNRVFISLGSNLFLSPFLARKEVCGLMRRVSLIEWAVFFFSHTRVHFTYSPPCCQEEEGKLFSWGNWSLRKCVTFPKEKVPYLDSIEALEKAHGVSWFSYLLIIIGFEDNPSHIQSNLVRILKELNGNEI